MKILSQTQSVSLHYLVKYLALTVANGLCTFSFTFNCPTRGD